LKNILPDTNDFKYINPCKFIDILSVNPIEVRIIYILCVIKPECLIFHQLNSFDS